MNNEPQEARHPKDDITLKYLLISLKSNFLEIVKNWKLIVILLAIALFYQTLSFLNTLDRYPAKLSFMVNEDPGQQYNAINGVLGQFGLGAPTSDYNLDKILELVKSRRISQSVLMSYALIDDRNELLANHYIEHLVNLDKWDRSRWYTNLLSKDSSVGELRDFKFRNDSIDYSDQLENKALKKIYRDMVGNQERGIVGSLKSDYSESSGIMSIEISTYNEALSIALTNMYFEKLSDFYIEKSIEKQKKTYDIIKTKYDSISTALRGAELALANFRDSNKGIFSNRALIQEGQLRNQITFLTAGLVEATKNLEAADFSLQSKTPFIQLIDAPIPPLDSDKRSLVRSYSVGLFFALLFSCLFIIARRGIRETFP